MGREASWVEGGGPVRDDVEHVAKSFWLADMCEKQRKSRNGEGRAGQQGGLVLSVLSGAAEGGGLRREVGAVVGGWFA